MHTIIYIYIYRERERERERDMPPDARARRFSPSSFASLLKRETEGCS